MSGKNNEDSYAFSTYQVSAGDATPTLLAVVADGIGGHRAGEVASRLAVDSISQDIGSSDAADPVATLQQAVTNASMIIRDHAEADLEQRGMGSTCVCVWIIGNRLYTAYVGDSRLYLVRGASIQQLTTDHTWVQEAIEHGMLLPEQVRGHPNAHVLRRYLGSPIPPQADFRMRLNPDEDDEQAISNQGTTLLPGDCLLLCSDGLTDLVEANEILAKVQSNTREEALRQLTDLANERGGHDNITLVLLEVPQKPAETEQLPAATPRPMPRSRRKLAIYCLGAVLLLIVGVSLSVGIAWVITHPEATVTPTPSQMPAPAIPGATASQLPEAGVDNPTVTINPLPTLSAPQLTPQPTGTAPPSQSSPEATYTPWPTNTTNPTQITASPEAFLR
jgi:protein phosphatase